MLLSPQLEAKTNAIKVIIIEDFKLTRVGLRCALNANEDIEVIAEKNYYEFSKRKGIVNV